MREVAGGFEVVPEERVVCMMKPFLGILVVLMVVLVASPAMAGRFWVAPVVPVVPAYYGAYYAPSGMAYFPPAPVAVAPVVAPVPVYPAPVVAPAVVYPVPVAYPAVIRARVYYPGWPRHVYVW